MKRLVLIPGEVDQPRQGVVPIDVIRFAVTQNLRCLCKPLADPPDALWQVRRAPTNGFERAGLIVPFGMAAHVRKSRKQGRRLFLIGRVETLVLADLIWPG